MSTSPFLAATTELEPPPNLCPALSNDDDAAIEYPQFLLLGDSITQFSTLTFQAYLQTQYVRRLDVVNRGLSGFTAPMGLKALQRLLPIDRPKSHWPHIKVLTVFFGANDACVPGQAQHVQLARYVDNIKKIVNYPVFKLNALGKTEIIVITPPPVNEHQFEEMPSGSFQRRACSTSQYAQAALEGAKACGAHVLDFWSIIMLKVGWTASMGRCCCSDRISPGDHLEHSTRQASHHIPGCRHRPVDQVDAGYKLSDFLSDGLHLTKLGYDVLYWELLDLIRRDIPHCAPENTPFVLPEWKDALDWDEASAPRAT